MTKSRIVSPPIDQLDKLRQPLTRGERIVFDFFNKYLPIEWEIYIQPHLNGLRPDFVLLHPRLGIAVFEIKDWNLQAMKYSVVQRNGKSPELWGEKDGKKFSLQHQNPIEKVYRYKQEIHDLYCPRIGGGKLGFAVTTTGVIFPFAADNAVKQLFAESLSYMRRDKYPQYNPLTGADSIHAKDINSVFPESRRKYSKFMNDDLAKDLRNWLVEPDFAKTQRQPLELDRIQSHFAKTRTKLGHRRIKGAAGSGKSLVLAARAAELFVEGKEVLVVTFNITLINYLKDIAVRHLKDITTNNLKPTKRIRKDITWLNFHSWCKRVCQENDSYEEFKNLLGTKDKDSVFNTDIPNLVASIVDDSSNVIHKYDAILVDEGQDFRPNWWDLLRKVCKKGGEMLLVADATQDIYNTARLWTNESMRGAGFYGTWVRRLELHVSYRLPPLLIQYARKFAQQFLPKDTVDIPEAEQDELIYPCTLKWVQTNMESATQACIEELFSLVTDTDPDIVSIPDITFLTDTNKQGRDMVSVLKDINVKSLHTFSEDEEESRRQKVGFYMGDARIKATTIHSFKGWESKAIVIFIGESVDKSLIYTGLTRLKRNVQGSYLTVISCAKELISYGKTWSNYIQRNKQR